MTDFNRRDFIRLGLQSGLLYVSMNPGLKMARALAAPLANAPRTAEFPLRPVLGAFSNQDFNGDDMTRAHDRLWNLAGFIASRGGRPPVSERRDVVVVGGGVSGLSSAYLLQSKRPLLLEQDAQFGGNSRGEIIGGTAFSIGAAYIAAPTPGSSLSRMLQTTGALAAARLEKPDDTRIHLRGLGFRSLWELEADAAGAQARDRFAQDIEQIAAQSYPNIPWFPGGIARASLDALDRVTFAQWLQQRYGNTLPVTLLEQLQLFCWSSFGGSMEEISAAQALNFVAGEEEGVVGFPGGNSYLAQAMYNHLVRQLGPDSVRAGTLVLEIRPVADGVEILLETPQGQLQTIACKTCVVAAPKYVAQHIVPNMSAEQKAASKKINYRAYVVANVLVNAAIKSPTFDSFMLQGQYPPPPSFGRLNTQRPFADVCFANWAQGDRTQPTVLTAYKPYAFDGARNNLVGVQAFNRVANEIRQNIGELLQTLNVPASAVSGIRLTRWGHALPLAQPGFLASHTDELFAQPTAGRIFYVNQDNNANPAFESAFATAERVAAQILRM